MLICKIFLRKFIHEVTSIITFDCRDNYSDIQENSMCKAGSAQKRKIYVELARLHLQQCLFHKSFAECFTSSFCIIIWRMTTEKAARAVGILRQCAGIRQVK